jgi:endonuclease/exonuclease/phosphatase family metal-dependent hydrolase
MKWIFAIALTVAAVFGQSCAAMADGKADSDPKDRVPIRTGVLTFNLRYGTAPDKENAWPKRKDQVFAILNDERLGIVGVQEALRGQLDDIHAACPKLGEIGVGRDDGKTKGEYSAILYRTDQWKSMESGTFWLSEMPEKPGSMSWKTACTRICTWARMERLGGGSDAGRVLWVFNTHMDHISADARLNGAKLIARRIAERGDVEPFVLTGDFNSGEDEEAARYFTMPGSGSPIGKLFDTYRVLHAEEREFGTFNNFDPKNTKGKKIDYVLVPPGTKVAKAWIDRRNRDGRTPSDHFAVGAIVEYP